MDIDPHLVAECLAEVKEAFPGLENTVELFSTVEELLIGQQFSFHIDSVKGTTERFTAVIQCNLTNEHDINSFLNNYLSRTNETMRIDKRKKFSTKSQYSSVLYYRCQHNTRTPKTRDVEGILQVNPGKKLKNCNCPMSMCFKLHKDSSRYPCTLSIKYCHNHATNSLQAWGYKDIRESTKSTIWSLFSSNMTPATAYKEFKRTIRCNSNSDIEFHKLIADRSILPLRRDFNTLYMEYTR